MKELRAERGGRKTSAREIKMTQKSILSACAAASEPGMGIHRGRGGHSPCASCKLLRRRCARDCIFAPYFPSDDPHKFAIVHKVFGASNVSKMLQELPAHQRADAGEQPGVRSEREGPGPGLRMRGRHLLLAEPGFPAADAARGGSSRGPVHPHAARLVGDAAPQHGGRPNDKSPSPSFLLPNNLAHFLLVPAS
ncbi:LOB domain-containing protein [Psidium guajava]|nr:LOB domain-containing protein [Psidium guajava]